jgi:4-amino-4-deoxy-L-arabinose transferase-like glycosyltransferase
MTILLERLTLWTLCNLWKKTFSSQTQTRWLASPLSITCVALLIRLGYLFIPSSRMSAFSLDRPPLGLEAANIAYSIAAHHGFSSPFLTISGPTGPTAWLAPLYPYLLSILVTIFGAHTLGTLLAALVLNQTFSAITCWPLFHIGKGLSGSTLGVVAAWLWAFFPVAIRVPYAAVWYTSLSAWLLAVLLLATLRVRQSQKAGVWVCYGFLWGIELLTNPSFLSTLPFVFLWLARELYIAKRSWFRFPFIAGLAIVLTCLPWTIRNYVAFHTLVPLRSNFGLELWRFNNSGGDLHPSSSSEDLNKYIRLGEIAYMQEKKQEAVASILSHPYKFLTVTKWRAASFWIVGWHNNSLIVALSNMALTMLVPVGLFFLYLSKRREFWLFVIFPLFFPLAYYVTISSVTYRHPIDPALIMTAAFAILGFRCFLCEVTADNRLGTCLSRGSKSLSGKDPVHLKSRLLANKT